MQGGTLILHSRSLALYLWNLIINMISAGTDQIHLVVLASV